MSMTYIGKYEVLNKIGDGTSGVVYKAKDPTIGRIVAIKTLKGSLLGEDTPDNEELQRFKRECQIAGSLKHPNIVTIFDAGWTNTGVPYLVMEYIEGKRLDEILEEKGVVPFEEAIEYLEPIASAIDYAHKRGVIHRDIKPANVIIDNDNHINLLDFGVAKLCDTSITPTGFILGTPSYMAPELIRGDKIDNKTDIYALAVVAYELVTGSEPFSGENLISLSTNIVNKQPKTFEEIECPLSTSIEAVLMKGLAKKKDERFETAGAFIGRLRNSQHEKAPESKPSLTTQETTSFKAVKKDKQKDDIRTKQIERPQKTQHKETKQTIQRTQSSTTFLPTKSLSPVPFIIVALLLLIGVGSYIVIELGKLPQQTAEKQAEKKDKEAKDILSEALDPNSMTKISAIKEIEKIGVYKEEKIIDILIQNLNDEDYLVRGFAAKLLAKAESEKAIQALQTRKEIEKNEIVQKVLNKLLGE